MDAQDASWKVDRVTASEMGKRMGCARQTVEAHAKSAAIERGTDGKYDAARLQAVIEANQERDNRLKMPQDGDVRSRKLELECLHLQLELEILQKKYVELALVNPFLSAMANEMKNEMLALGPRVGGRCEGQPAAKISAIITAAQIDILRHMSKTFEPPPEK